MIKISVPATSANLGPGFDCLGMALSLYNTFEIEVSDTLQLDNVEERFNNPDNLFVQAYMKGMKAIGRTGSIHAVFHCDIPVSRGLGSSAAMITGGLYAASVLHDSALSKDQIFELAAEMEGHPDNAAPCVYGGLTACLKQNDSCTVGSLNLDSNWITTVLIPSFEVSTASARAILPASVSLKDAADNGAHAILMVHALETGNEALMKLAAKDLLHEPYRKNLIPHFDAVKRISEHDTGGACLISGSGSTCLLISRQPLSRVGLEELAQVPGSWNIRQLSVDPMGVSTLEAD